MCFRWEIASFLIVRYRLFKSACTITASLLNKKNVILTKMNAELMFNVMDYAAKLF